MEIENPAFRRTTWGGGLLASTNQEQVEAVTETCPTFDDLLGSRAAAPRDDWEAGGCFVINYR